MTTLYGISNCDTIKKARRWLDDAGIAYTWHDYKKSGISFERLHDWSQQLGWETLLNRKGTTWRKLDEAVQASITDANSACLLMHTHTSLIRRPLLEHEGMVIAGFDETNYIKIFKSGDGQ